MIKRFILLLFILLIPFIGMTQETGLMINQYVDYGSRGADDNFFEYNAQMVPRFLLYFGDNNTQSNFLGTFFVSAGMTLGYSEELVSVPELLRTELALQWGTLGLSVGRFTYSTPLPFLAQGLFDGLRISHSSGLGHFSFNAFYSGFLYKKNIVIEMTENDRAINNTSLDNNDLSKTYFAPPRVMASLDWEHLAIADLLRMNIALTGQFDLTRSDESYHSQYLTFKMGIPVNSFFFELGTIFSLSQTGNNNDLNLAFAGDLGLNFTLPTAYNSRISLNTRYASGQIGNLFDSFNPITTRSTGDVFQARMSSLTVLELAYIARITEQLGINISAKYFMQNDLYTINSYPLAGEQNNGHFLGSEFFVSLSYSAFSDLYFNLGGGIFLPQHGNNWPSSYTIRLIKLAVIFTAY